MPNIQNVLVNPIFVDEDLVSQFAQILGLEPEIVKAMPHEDLKKAAETKLSDLCASVATEIEKEHFEAAANHRHAFKEAYRLLLPRGLAVQDQNVYQPVR